jgi:hypothetical protein
MKTQVYGEQDGHDHEDGVQRDPGGYKLQVRPLFKEFHIYLCEQKDSNRPRRLLGSLWRSAVTVPFR